MVKREGRYFIPKGNTELKENDKLLMISDNDEALLQAYDSLGVKDYTMKKNWNNVPMGEYANADTICVE